MTGILEEQLFKQKVGGGRFLSYDFSFTQPILVILLSRIHFYPFSPKTELFIDPPSFDQISLPIGKKQEK